MAYSRPVMLSLITFLIAAAGCADSAPASLLAGDGFPIASAGGSGDSAVRIEQGVGPYVPLGSTFELTTNYARERNGRNVATVRWSSSDPTVVSVGNSTGIIRALKTGKATVTARHSVGGVDSLPLTVLDTAAFNVSPSTVDLSLGDSIALTTELDAPAGWHADDSTVVRVTDTGVIYALAEGFADVFATSPIGTRGVSRIHVTGGSTPPNDTTSAHPPPEDTTSVPPPPAPPGESPAELPRVYLHDMVEEARTAPVIRTISVSTAGELQSALDTSKYGDEIVLSPGTYTGSFVLRRKTQGSGWITIRGKTASSLPPAGVRIRPSNAGALPKLHASGNAIPVLKTEPGAKGYRLVHLELSATPSSTLNYTLIWLGATGSSQNTLVQIPSDFVLDRVYIHGHANLNFQRCMALQSARTAIIDSWISECHGKGYDSQAIANWNGPGPYMIVNNHLEGAGENLMFGGADPSVPDLLPEDIEIRRNYFFKPSNWNGLWTVKNLFELKVGRRVLVEENLFENCWPDAQVGFAITLKSVNQSGAAPWSETADVTFRYNIVRNSAHGISLAGRPESHPAVPMSRVYIGHNSFEKIGTGSYPGGRLWEVVGGGVDDLTFEHNSGAVTYYGLSMAGVSTNLRVLNNVFGTVEPRYGAWDWAIVGSTARGTGALNKNATNWEVLGNVITAPPLSAFPAGNSWPAEGPAGLGAVSFPHNLKFLPSSPFINKGTDGVMPGVDFDVLAARTAGVVVPP